MRKLLGYRLKEERYYETASMIMYGDPSGSTVLKSVVKADSVSHNRLQQAGVMHWFEEVYEEDKPKYNKGDLVVCEIGGYPNWIGVYDRSEEKGVYMSEWTLSYNIDWKKRNGGLFDSIVRHATKEEKAQYFGNTLNGKTAIIDGVEYELKIKN